MNRVVHFEIMADDLDRAQKFYESVFGWKFIATGPEFGNYRIIMTGPGPDEMLGKTMTPDMLGINGGMMQRNAPVPEDGKSPNAFTCIVGVDDIDAYITKADAAGGKPQTEKMNVPGVGKLRYYKDTEGNIFGMLQPDMPKK
jgi:predicted enzyme related to lactoylglutathione lyase